MIYEADVGVGIFGKEGRQAALAADFSIGQFRFLSKLLLVHGQWYYYRSAELVMNFMFKSFIWTSSLFWFQTVLEYFY